MTQPLTVAEARRSLEPPLTQEQLADAVGVDQTYISLIEAGKRRPSEDLKSRLAQALRIAPSRLRFLSPAPARRVSQRTARATGRSRRAPQKDLA